MNADDHGGPRRREIPDGDNRERLVCPDCGYVRYDNPKIIVGVLADWQGRYLLVRRAIAPRIGYWTLPAGFLELNETARDGAAREAWEEARARVAVGPLLGLYDLSHISQIHLIYRARLLAADVRAGPESQEVGLFARAQIPWDRLAFPSVRWALDHDRDTGTRTDFAPHENPEPPHSPE